MEERQCACGEWFDPNSWAQKRCNLCRFATLPSKRRVPKGSNPRVHGGEIMKAAADRYASDYGVKPEIARRIVRNQLKCRSFLAVHWRPVPGYEARYHISDHGDILSLVQGRRILRPATREFGRVAVLTNRIGIASYHLVHRLVLQVFRPIANDHLYTAKFKNGDCDDIRLSNLEWVLSRNHATLNESDVRAIRARWMSDPSLTYQALGDEYGVTFSAIYKIVAGKTWANVS